LVTENGLANCALPIRVGQSSVNALPKRLGKCHSLREGKRHRFVFELLSGHNGKLAGEECCVNAARERMPNEKEISRQLYSGERFKI
jgi:hypothetical protein